MTKPIMIAVGATGDCWEQRFVAAIEQYLAAGYPLRYGIVNLDAHDWLRAVAPYDVILWKPHIMGVQGASHFKEKIYVLEKLLHKLVVPNYNTIWHFESKVAQSYLFDVAQVPTPATTVSFDPADALAQLKVAALPVVFKRSTGAASKYVRLIHRFPQAMSLRAKPFAANSIAKPAPAAGQNGKPHCTLLCGATFGTFWSIRGWKKSPPVTYTIKNSWPPTTPTCESP